MSTSHLLLLLLLLLILYCGTMQSSMSPIGDAHSKRASARRRASLMRSVTGLAHVPRGHKRITAASRSGGAGSDTTAGAAVPPGGMPQGLVDALQEVVSSSIASLQAVALSVLRCAHAVTALTVQHSRHTAVAPCVNVHTNVVCVCVCSLACRLETGLRRKSSQTRLWPQQTAVAAAPAAAATAAASRLRPRGAALQLAHGTQRSRPCLVLHGGPQRRRSSGHRRTE
jgi:hypothetical protein